MPIIPLPPGIWANHNGGMVMDGGAFDHNVAHQARHLFSQLQSEQPNQSILTPRKLGNDLGETGHYHGSPLN